MTEILPLLLAIASSVPPALRIYILFESLSKVIVWVLLHRLATDGAREHLSIGLERSF
jgi:hypothetical protein